MVEDQISVDSMTEVLHFRKYVFFIFFAQGRREDQYHSYTVNMKPQLAAG